jgi:uncharacterized membrane protein YfcA
MAVLVYSVGLFFISGLTGVFGILTGLGGGMLLVPILSALGVNLYIAMGTSLVSIIATSLTAAITQSSRQFTHIKAGIFLETGAVIGAFAGTILLSWLSVRVISIVFSIVLLCSAYTTFKRRMIEETLSLELIDLSNINLEKYPKSQLGAAWSLMIGGGVLSSILGVGSGAVKVLAMDQVLQLPYKVSTATSNFMVGMTAATSIGFYWVKGYIQPQLVFPVVLGIFAGALIGSKILQRARSKSLREVFSVIIVLLALHMLYVGTQGTT